MKIGQKNIKDQSTVTNRKVLVKKSIFKEEKKDKYSNFDSLQYWQTRYVNGGNSGSGSYGMLAEYKKNFINNFIQENKIKILFEYGCGDCNQLNLIECEKIIGADVSSQAIENCKKMLPNHQFFVLKKNKKITKRKIDLIVSLDVLYHLIEDDVYENYMKNLTSLDSEYLIIYSSNFEDDGTFARHVKPRRFTQHPSLIKNYDLIHFEKNKYNEKQEDMNLYSNSDWFIYKKK